MATIDEHHMIRHTMLRRSVTTAEQRMLLWQRLAGELTSIIGAGGFDTLYARSVHLARRVHPALPATGHSLDSLHACLAQLSQDDADAIHLALLTIFTDTLILLIGEPVTTAILRSAWGDDSLDNAGKENKQ